jgi:hypothetical protein
MSKKSKLYIDKLNDLIGDHLEALEANAEPLAIAAAMLRVFQQIHNCGDRMEALEMYFADGNDSGAHKHLCNFFQQADLDQQARHAYLLSVEKTILEGYLQQLAPGVGFQVYAGYFQKFPETAKFHYFSVRSKDFHVLDGDNWVISPAAHSFGIGDEHFKALEQVLAMFFNYPIQLNLRAHHSLDYLDENMQFAMEKQVQAILQNLYLLEVDGDLSLTAYSPLAGLLGSAGVLPQDRDMAMPHLPPLESLERLRIYLRSAAFGNAHKTLTERLQQAARSHPEQYRIALNRMVRELFRKHYLIEMDDQFQVTVLMPDEQGRYKVRVDAPVFATLKKQSALTDKHLQALTWMLESLFNHAEELELPNNIWKKEDEA